MSKPTPRTTGWDRLGPDGLSKARAASARPKKPTAAPAPVLPSLAPVAAAPSAALLAVAATTERQRILGIFAAAKEAGGLYGRAMKLAADPNMSVFTARQRFAEIKANNDFRDGVKAAGDYVQAAGLIR